MSTMQFGFLVGHSSLQQLLIFFMNISESVHANCQSDVIFLDFARAFDIVPHHELLVKLRSMGICGHLWSWFLVKLRSMDICGLLWSFLVKLRSMDICGHLWSWFLVKLRSMDICGHLGLGFWSS